jgi:hypothetical protein
MWGQCKVHVFQGFAIKMALLSGMSLALCGCECRLSKELSGSNHLQHVIVAPEHDSKAAAAVAAAGQLAAGQPTAMPAALSTEAAASAVVGSGGGVTRRRGWFGRRGAGKGGVGEEAQVAGKGGDVEKVTEEPVKVGGRVSHLSCH